MKKLTSSQIISAFIEYFESHQHLKISSSSLIPQSDPTLLYINSGMAPLKPYFLGIETPPKPCLVNVQPCIRTIDIDDVGDRHHLTLFEMLGSWSIGDYYKEKAVTLAHGFLVGHLGFEPKRLYMSVYGGNKALQLEPDEVSAQAWRKMGVLEDHIVRLGDDNFWGPAGETGPCGPCTEVFYDTGEAFGPAYIPGTTEFDSVGRYIEIWNAGVFMELNKLKNGQFKALPLKSVDTGSGVERMAMIMQGVDSVYETDLLGSVHCMVIAKFKAAGETELSELKIRMLTDHIRAAIFILGEGVTPSNEGRGYIPRKLIRKCVSSLVSVGIKGFSFEDFVDLVVKNHAGWYPHLSQNKKSIKNALELEVKEFLPHIEQGIEFMETEMERTLAATVGSGSPGESSKKTFSGEKAFQLVSTFGLPLEVIESYLNDKSWTLDRQAYETHNEKHKKVSRVIRSSGQMGDEAINWAQELTNVEPTNFVGYDLFATDGKVLKIFHRGVSVEQVGVAEEIFFICDKTPFYGESGGQEGDTGVAQIKQGSALSCEIEICSTQKEGQFIIHAGKVTTGVLKLAATVNLQIGASRRKAITRNHSATHLMHKALMDVLGDQANQKGSLVKPTGLRFDFNHPQAVTALELQRVEQKVNEMILANIPTETDILDYDEAIQKGAMALFGEKYTEKVRVVSLGKESVELCGGTHVAATGDIGLFMIESEASVSKGIRRIEALTGVSALKRVQTQQSLLKEAAQLLASSESDLPIKIKGLIEKAKKGAKGASPTEKAALGTQKTYNIKDLSLDILVAEATGDLNSVKELGDQWITQNKYSLIVLIATDGDKLKLYSWSAASKQKKWPAASLLKHLIEPLGGRGGGRPNFAQGGISDKKDMAALLASSEESIAKWSHS